VERALAVLLALRPLLYREGAGGSAAERAGFDPDAIPALVALSEAGGSRPLGLLAVLVRIVQEQQATIAPSKSACGRSSRSRRSPERRFAP
jgi:hypothetical protein